MGFLPLINKKISNTFNRVTTVKNNAIRRTKSIKVVQRVKGSVRNKLYNLSSSKGFVVLTPYKQLMRLVLAKRGHAIKNSASIATVTVMFYDVVIRGKNHFDYAYYNKIEHLSSVETNNAVDNLISQSGGAGLSVASEGAIPPEVSSSIIKVVLDYIKGIIGKKEQGQNLTPEENIIVNEDKKVEDRGELVTTTKQGWLMEFISAIFGGHKENFRTRIDSRNRKTVMVQKPSNTIVTIPNQVQVNPISNSTELGMMSAIGGKLQNFRSQGTVVSANDLLGEAAKTSVSPRNITSVGTNLQPNNVTWFQKRGVWYYIDKRGHTRKG